MSHSCPKILCETCLRCCGFNVGVHGQINARCQLHSGDLVWVVPKNRCDLYEEVYHAE